MRADSLRLPSLILVALAFTASPSQAQDAPAPQARPSLNSTYVVPSMPGEAVRVTIYARRPPQSGRLARRYRGLRADRSPRRTSVSATGRPQVVTGLRAAERTYSTPHHSFVRRGGSFFQIVPQR